MRTMILFLALYVCVSFVQTRCQLMAKNCQKYVAHYFNCVAHCHNILITFLSVIVSDQNQNSVSTEVAGNVLWGKESLGATMVFLTSNICDQYS